MTRLLRSLIAVTISALAFSPVAAQKGYDLFQQALAKERAEARPREAIAIYQQIVGDAGSDRALVARALIQMAGCYDKIGSAEARRTYERVVNDFADQTEQFAIAKARLGTPAGGRAPLPAGQQPTVRPVNVPAGGTVSPDGSKVAYVEGKKLFVSALAGGPPTSLLEAPAGQHVGEQLVWSKDSRRLAVNLCGNATPRLPNTCDQRVMEADGSGSRTIVPRRDEGIDPVDWSPDDRQILAVFFGSPTPDQAQLVLVGVADGAVRTLLTTSYRMLNGTPFSPPAFSPDGQFVALTDPVHNDVVIVPTDGSGEAHRLEHPADDTFVAWTPSNGGLLFLSDRSGTNDLWRIDMTGGRPVGLPLIVTRDLGNVSPITMTLGGSLYLRRQSGTTYDVEIMPMDPATGDARGTRGSVTQSNRGRNNAAEWSRDGRYLAYITAPADTGRFDSITIVSIDTSKERTVRVEPRVNQLLALCWSPDDKWFLATGFTAAGVDVYRIDAETGKATPLGFGKELGGLKLGPDGRTLVFGASASWPQPRPTELFTRDLDGGTDRPFFKPAAGQGTSNLALSADGTQLAVTLSDSAAHTVTLVTIEIATGQSRKVVQLQSPTVQAGAKVEWSPDGKFLYYVDRMSSGLRDEIWRVSTTGGTPRPIGLAVDENIRGIRISPDGRQLAFTVVRPTPAGTVVLEPVLSPADLRKGDPPGIRR